MPHSRSRTADEGKARRGRSGARAPAAKRQRFNAPAALIVAIFAAPLLAFWTDVAWFHPARNYYTVDTEFPYFLNSLEVFKGQAYSYVDHPGTPLQMFGTALLGLTYPFLAGVPGGFVAFHVRHPELFLDAARSALILAHIACIAVFFWVARRSNAWDEALGAAALATMYFAIHPSALGASTVWNHNSFSFPLGTLLLLLLYRALHRPDGAGEIEVWKLALLGLGAGVLAAITIYLAAWTLGLLVSLGAFYILRRQRWSRTIVALAVAWLSSVLGFGISVLPVARKLPIFQNWIFSILTHQSRYLAVPADEPMFSRIGANAWAFFEMLPVLWLAAVVLIALALLAAFVLRAKLRSRPAASAFIIGLVVQLIALLLVFLDRPLRDAYLLAIAAMVPPLALALLTLLDGRPRLLRSARVGLGLLVLTGITITAVASIQTKRRETAALEVTQIETSRVIRDYAEAAGRQPKDLTVLWMYGAYSPCWGLRTGDALAADTFAGEIDAVCPNQYRLGINLRYDVHGDPISLQEGAWDILFTCDQYVRRLADSLPDVSIERVDDVQWGCGVMNVIRRQ